MESIIKFLKSMLIYCLSGIIISLIVISISFIKGIQCSNILKYVALAVVIISCCGIIGSFKGTSDIDYVHNRGMYQDDVSGTIEDTGRTINAIYRGVKLLLTAAIIYGISLLVQ